MMEPKLVKLEQKLLAGLEYFGPFKGEGWTTGNVIGQLWHRFEQVWQRYEDVLKLLVVNPNISYELAVWNEAEVTETQNFGTFVGVEVTAGAIGKLPLELVIRVAPTHEYATFTVKGETITSWEKEFYGDWMMEHGYALAEFGMYSMQIQAYEEGRFKGVGDLLAESEVDLLIPVVKAS